MMESTQWVASLSEPQKGRISEALEQIDESKEERDGTLVLCERGLTLEDLELLMPYILEIENLTLLDLRDNDLLDLPEDMSKLSELTHLDLGQNKFEKFPELITKLVNLELLRLDHNTLQGGLPPEIGNLTSLEILNLEETKLSALPKEIGKLVSLIELEVSDNQISELPEEIGQMTSLEFLFLGKNVITKLPEAMVKLKEKLYGLNVEYNNLSVLPDSMIGSRCLSILNLQHNNFTKVPAQIAGMISLKMLNLSQNSLVELPDFLGNLEQLEQLQLAENELQEFPSALGNLINLEQLYLNDNQLKEIPSSFGDLIGLQAVSLMNNPMETLPDSLTHLSPELRFSLDLNTLHPGVAKMMINNFYVFREVLGIEDPNDTDLCTLVLEKIYPDRNGQDLWNQIAQMDHGEFEVNGNSGKRSWSTVKVVKEFLEKLPIYDAMAQSVYNPAAKQLIDSILNPEVSEVEKKDTLQEIATALGDCGTPIKHFLAQCSTGQWRDRNEDLPNQVRKVLMAMAITQTIRTELQGSLKGSEATEQLAALLHSLFLKNASKKRNNPVKIDGMEEKLPPFSKNIEFGFHTLDAELIQSFVHLCCKTNEDGPLLNQDGRYQMDPKKINAMIEPFLASLGLVSIRERAVQEYGKALGAIMASHTNLWAFHYENPQVEALLSTPVQQRELRLKLFDASDAEIQKVTADLMQQKKDLIAQLEDSYSDQTLHLSGLQSPINIDRQLPLSDAGIQPAGSRSPSPSPSTSEARAPKRPCLR